MSVHKDTLWWIKDCQEACLLMSVCWMKHCVDQLHSALKAPNELSCDSKHTLDWMCGRPWCASSSWHTCTQNNFIVCPGPFWCLWFWWKLFDEVPDWRMKLWVDFFFLVCKGIPALKQIIAVRASDFLWDVSDYTFKCPHTCLELPLHKPVLLVLFMDQKGNRSSSKFNTYWLYSCIEPVSNWYFIFTFNSLSIKHSFYLSFLISAKASRSHRKMFQCQHPQINPLFYFFKRNKTLGEDCFLSIRLSDCCRWSR